MKYLLDANAIVDLLRNPQSRLSRRVRKHAPTAFGISAIVSHELFYGAFKGTRLKGGLAIVDGLEFEVLAFDKEDARLSGEIRAGLTLRGMSIGPLDVLIAGQAKSRGLILITHNISEFSRVPGLRIEDWE